MSWRTNRRTGQPFRRDFTPSEIQSQTRRFTCPRCVAMFGEDIDPQVAEQEARITGRERAGTPIASFITREELMDHIEMVHGERRLPFPTKEHRQLGRIAKPQVQSEEMEEVEGGDEGSGADIMTDEEEGPDGTEEGDILGPDEEKEDVF